MILQQSQRSNDTKDSVSYRKDDMNCTKCHFYYDDHLCYMSIPEEERNKCKHFERRDK